MSLQSTGNRNSPVNPSQPLVGMYGCSACRFGIWSITWPAIATITVATIAPGPESVSVEIHKPTAVIPDAASRMYSPEPTTRASASVVESVVPLNVGSGPKPTFSGTTLSTTEALARVVGSGLYILLAASGITAVGLWISTLTDSGPGAIVATVIVAIAGQVIDQIPNLHVLHPYVPTHGWLGFTGLFRFPV